MIVSPGAYYTTQAKSSEFTLGMHSNYNLSGDGELQVIGGVYYRSEGCSNTYARFSMEIGADYLYL